MCYLKKSWNHVMMKEELWVSVNTQVKTGKEIRLEPVIGQWKRKAG